MNAAWPFSWSFTWPWALLLLPLPWLLAPLVGLLFARARGPRSAATHAEPPALPPVLAHALGRLERDGVRRVATARPYTALAWVALVAAIAQPVRPGELTVTPVSGRAIALAIDVSGSMERDDFALDGERADRLAVVQRVAADFISRREGDRVGLVLFGKEAFIASPLTFDLAALADTLRGAGIGMAGRSTAIGDALGLALSMLRTDPATDKAIVLLSDGTNNAGSVEPEAAAELAASLGTRVHTIALGSDTMATDGYALPPSADLDEATLEALAERAGGRFFRARTSDDLVAVYAEIDRLATAAADAPPTRLREPMMRWPLLALLVLLGLSAWREERP